MPASSVPRRALLLGYFDRGNVGDDLMRDALVSALPPLMPGARIESARLPQFSLGSVLEVVRLLRRLIEADLVVLAGGSHFHDRFGWRSIRLLTLLLGLVALAKASGARVGYAGIGVGPLEGRLARALTRGLLGLADAVLVRDARSAELCRSLHGRVRLVEGLDLALLLPALEPTQRGLAPSGPPTLGVSLTPYFREFEGNPGRDARVIKAVATAVARVAAERPLRVLLLPLFDPPGDATRSDVMMSVELAARLRALGVDALVCESSVEQVQAALAECQWLLASRFHAALLGYVTRVPTALVAYDVKCSSLADELGLPLPALLMPQDLLDSALVETRMRALLAEPHEFTWKLPLEDAGSASRAGLRGFVDALGAAERASARR